MSHSKSHELEAVDRMGRTALINAAIDGKIAEVARLLDGGAKVAAADSAGWTALHFAARDQNVELARLLLKRGAPVNAQDAHGNTPLFRAVFSSNQRTELSALLLASGADKELKNKANTSAADLARRMGGQIAVIFG